MRWLTLLLFPSVPAVVASQSLANANRYDSSAPWLFIFGMAGTLFGLCGLCLLLEKIKS